MYINFWYPVVLDKELAADKPFQTQILGVKLAAFRNADGEPQVIADTCVHRGGSLGKGWVENGRLICPYHGWQYGGDGKCHLIPSLADDEKPPARAKVDSYPIQVKYGIVFAFLGDLPEQERPPIWDVDVYEDPDWRACEINVFDVDYYYQRSVENGLDAAHNEFVHPNQGAPAVKRNYRTDPIDIINFPWGSKFTLNFSRDKKGMLGEKLQGDQQEESEGLVAGSGHLGPNTLATWIQLKPTEIFHQYFFEAPIDQENTRIFFLNMRSFILDEDMDEDIMEINMAIAHEDVAVVRELNPRRPPDSNIKEVLMPADATILRYRELLKEWDAKGWRIDIKAFNEKLGEEAMAIPCPDRKTSKGWVLDAVPLMPAIDK